MISSIIATLIIISLVLYYFIFKVGIFKKSYWPFFLNKTNKYIENTFANISLGSILNIIKSFKFIYPIFISLFVFISLMIINSYYEIPLKSRILHSLMIGLYFILPLLKMIYKNGLPKFVIKPNIFTLFIQSILFILTLFSYVHFQWVIEGEIKGIMALVHPLMLWVSNSIEQSKVIIQAIPIYVIVLYPIFFILFFNLTMQIYKLFHQMGRNIDFKLKEKLSKNNPSIIFGDSISLYPTILNGILYYFIVVLLLLLINPIADIFNQLLETFQVKEVFNFTFLTEENIFIFIKTVIYISCGLIIGNTIYHFFSSLFSHFILFRDEIVYYENKLIKKTILRLPLNRINYVIVKQNIIERFFDIGTIYIETIDKNGYIKIKGISSIKEKNILIMDKIKSDL
jgi:hypothetical protein